jgi:enterobactin synthetase component D
VPKRRAEYVAGRYCAATALRAIVPFFNHQIATRGDGSPSWPVGLVGSITHAHGFASAAVARAEHVRGIGIDSESLLGLSSVSAVRQLAARPEEQPPGGRLGAQEYYTLLFSAKESVFKCLYPIVQRMFDFQDARVTFEPEAGTFHVTVLADLGAEISAGFALHGRWTIADSYAHTGVALAAR